MRIAITRAVSRSIAACNLVHLPRQPIALERARAQHAAYEQALSTLGCRLERLPEEPTLPDAVFVEDAAVVLDELAVITRPGAVSRRPETSTVARALKPYRVLAHVVAPGTVDGGDVLRVDRQLFIGLSARTNEAGIAQLAAVLEPHGYAVTAVPVTRCLHLKSAVTAVAPGTILLSPRWIDPARFVGLRHIEVDPAEPAAANGLRVGDRVLYATAFPRTRARLEQQGIAVVSIDLSELAKAEAAVTCCSLIVED
ncbi:MAG: arginine deiminase family protein [Pseudomonadota bacterium]